MILLLPSLIVHNHLLGLADVNSMESGVILSVFEYLWFGLDILHKEMFIIPMFGIFFFSTISPTWPVKLRFSLWHTFQHTGPKQTQKHKLRVEKLWFFDYNTHTYAQSSISKVWNWSTSCICEHKKVKLIYNQAIYKESRSIHMHCYSSIFVP